MITLATWKQGTSPESTEFEEIEFWTQFHGVPWDHYTDAAAKAFAKRMGSFKLIDHSEQGYLCVRIGIDIDKPLV